MNCKYTANQDIRDYMADHGVSQLSLAKHMGVTQFRVNTMLKNELSEKEKEELLRHIDAIAGVVANDDCATLEDEQIEETDVSSGTKFQIGDRVKIPSKATTIGIVADIWHSLVQDSVMYAVDDEGGHRGLYAEDQLELAPLPITYSWEAHIDGNVAVVAMNATQGDKTWVYARGHAHILHDGEVGMAQANSFAARRMFESLDSKQETKIYVK
jgi:predicted transcriptional regulator